MTDGSWQKALLGLDTTIEQAIRNLNDSTLKIVLVVGEDNELIGTITDGDIRRGLLRGLTIKSPVESIVHVAALSVPVEMSKDSVAQLMRTNKLNHLPVVDEKKRVVGLHALEDMYLSKAHENTMVIMAGGQGTRLRPHTENCPKPMLPVDGKPMLEHIIEGAKLDGFRKFVLSIHYLGHMIEDYFGDGDQWQVHIDYLRENSPMGTAGAIAFLNPRPEAPFLVSNADVLTDINYGALLDFHCRHGAMATMAVRLFEWQNPFGVVRTNGIDFIDFEEKPIARSHVNAGVYVLDPYALDVLKPGAHCDMPTLFSRLQERDARVIVYPIHEPWLDVGRHDDYVAAQKRNLDGQKR